MYWATAAMRNLPGNESPLFPRGTETPPLPLPTWLLEDSALRNLNNLGRQGGREREEEGEREG